MILKAPLDEKVGITAKTGRADTKVGTIKTRKGKTVKEKEKIGKKAKTKVKEKEKARKEKK